MEKEGYPNGVMRNGDIQIGKWRNGDRRNGETERVESKNGERRNEDTQIESSNGGKVKWGTEKCGNSQSRFQVHTTCNMSHGNIKCQLICMMIKEYIGKQLVHLVKDYLERENHGWDLVIGATDLGPLHVLGPDHLRGHAICGEEHHRTKQWSTT
ncbi:hypothetical protein TNCV_96031 [Trichonephila clavipes]|nr:hypothetical protein TNCV_96031 [Trichonephila clavipes]